MRIETHQGTGHYKRKTWVVGIDVHEIHDFMELPTPGVNIKQRDQLEAHWRGERYDGEPTEDHYGRPRENPKLFYLGRLKSVDSLRKLHEKGWKKGSEKALKLAEGLLEGVSQPLGIRRRIRWRDNGDEFDKERLIDGHLDSCWRTTERQIAVATPIINIAVGWGGNSNMSHDQLFWSGASALALIQILEIAGYQTSLTAVCTNDLHSETEAIAICCRVKQAGEYLRSDALASIICHAATFRVYLFAAVVASPFDIPDGLGHNCDVDRVIPAAIGSGILETPQVVLPDVFDQDSARRSIENALKELQAANLAALPEIRR